MAAAHEAGHAVALCELYPNALQAVSLRSGEGTGGGTLSVVEGAFLSAADVHQGIICLLAGRAVGLDRLCESAPNQAPGLIEVKTLTRLKNYPVW